MQIGERLRNARTEKGLTQKQLQDLSGVLRGQISSIENSQIIADIETLRKMAIGLRISLHSLICKRHLSKSHKMPG